MKCTLACFVLGLASALAAAANDDVIHSLPAAVALKTVRGVNIEENLRNNTPSFMVRVDVDRPDRTYEIGQLMQVSVESEKDGYLYLLYKQADGSEKCLFPNKYDNNNRIFGGRKITIPTAASRFNLRITPPSGEELLVALVTLERLPDNAFGDKSLTKSAVTDIDLDTVIAKGVEAELRTKPQKWAEHCVKIATFEKEAHEPARPAHRRIGLFVGISDYKDPRIRDLHICHKDAEIMAAIMKERCNLDGIGLLTNERATRETVEKAFSELKLKSKPGDEIFIYWSGHGASCADTNGDEADGRDEFLVPYDGNPEDIAGSMLLDDTLGRWTQALDGRKVCIILDACHSGGQATGKNLKGILGNEKFFKGLGYLGSTSKGVGSIIEDVNKDASNAIENPLGIFENSGPGGASGSGDFFDSEYGRIKDIGQEDATMLVSSAADEISAERRDGKLSVMTYYLAECIAKRNSVTLAEAFKYIREQVPKYMEANFPGRKQTPELLPEAGGVNVKLR